MKQGYEQNHKRKNFPIIYLLIIIAILIVGVCIICTITSNQDVKYSKMMLKEKRYDGLRIENIKYSNKNEKNYLEFEVVNLTKNDYEEKKTYVVFLGEDAKMISKYPIKIPKIESNSKTKLKIRVQKNDLYSYTFLISDL